LRRVSFLVGAIASAAAAARSAPNAAASFTLRRTLRGHESMRMSQAKPSSNPLEEPMQRGLIITAGAMLAALATVASAHAQTRVEVGVLTCNARGSTGFIIGSTRELRCRFNRQGRDEYYRGTIDKFGLDIGATKQAKISWAVLAPTSNVSPRSLNGTYAGVSAEATVGLGVGANALIGGSQRSIVLQPWSVQAQEGLNIAAGVSQLRLATGR
jgi:acyl-coenzyme A thioesterase PaaI-like protein